jgi:hypothetical protein
MRYLIVSILLISLHLNSFSQESNSKSLYNFRVGVKTSINIPKLNGTDKWSWTYGPGFPIIEQKLGYKPGLSVSFFTIFDVTKKINLQPEPTVNFIFLNHPEDPSIPYAFPAKRRLMRFSLPLLTGYDILRDKLSLQIGPQLNYTFNNKLFVDNPDIYFGTGVYYPEFTNKIGIGVTGGLQLRLNSLIVSARYEYGISKNEKDSFRYSGTSDKLNLLHLSVGYLIF